MAAPALADDVGVHAGPVGAGVTVGQTHDHDRTVIKEREPTDRKTVIKKEDENGNREKMIFITSSRSALETVRLWPEREAQTGSEIVRLSR